MTIAAAMIVITAATTAVMTETEIATTGATTVTATATAAAAAACPGAIVIVIVMRTATTGIETPLPRQPLLQQLPMSPVTTPTARTTRTAAHHVSARGRSNFVEELCGYVMKFTTQVNFPL